ncbi:acyltransferase [Lacrimispora brassicae]
MEKDDFVVRFGEYMKCMRAEMKEKYNRVLPSGELIFNRFEKAKYLGFGEDSSIYDTSIVMGDVQVGKNVWIGPYTLLEGSNAKLEIGDFVSVDAGVMIYTHDSTRYYVSGGKTPFSRGPVTIKNNTVIGTMSMVSCNVTIGNHCVIAAHSFVNTDVPDYSIYAGIPAKKIGQVIEDEKEGVRFEYF